MPISVVNSGQVLCDPAYMRTQFNRLAPEEKFQFFYDFTEKAIVEADSPFTFNAGSDDLAIDPAIDSQAGGVIRLSAGDGDGTVAVDGSQLVLAVPFEAENGGLSFECRLKITDITLGSVFVGFTDVTTLEEPFSVSGTTVTSNCSDGVGFVFDTAMTTDEWWMVGVAGDTDATGNGTTSEAPVNATYQRLRVDVDADGEGASFYIDGTLVGSLTANVVTAGTAVYFTVFACGDGSNGSAHTVDVDYILVESTRV